MQTAEKRFMTVAEYLEFERRSETRHEFVNGEVFAIAGGSELHSRLSVRVAGQLDSQLRGKRCHVYNADMRLHVEATGHFSYPDVQVACDPRFEGDKRDVLLNPSVIVEVLSDATAAWDRGEKFWHYRHIESFKEYVLVSQDAWLIEHYAKQSNGGWLLETVEGHDAVLRLPVIQCQIPLVEIYGDSGLSPDARPSIAPQPKTKS
jgi:Uma2 family endonuclease